MNDFLIFLLGGFGFLWVKKRSFPNNLITGGVDSIGLNFLYSKSLQGNFGYRSTKEPQGFLKVLQRVLGLLEVLRSPQSSWELLRLQYFDPKDVVKESNNLCAKPSLRGGKYSNYQTG